jgi:protein-S-isoprenylcysteine O-methyltransferase Ste14
MMIFIIIWSFWFISEIALNRLLRSNQNDKKDKDKNTIRIIWITIGVANSLGIIFSFFSDFLISNVYAIPFAGLIIIIIGMLFRFFAIWSLGKLFTVDVTIRKNHTIKKDGIYKIIRHPSYLGSLISFFGFGISLNNWVSLLIIIIPVTTAMINRIKIEEKLLIEHFGIDYLEYMKKTYRLMPFVY